MNTSTHTEQNALQTVGGAALTDTGRTSASNLMMDVATMESLMRVADLMASGKSTVPVHLQKNAADCMAVVMQSMQWGMNPFAVAQKTHVVNGQLGYEAQLVNAVVQESRSISGRFHYEYKGASPALECRVGAVIRGESEVTWGEWLNENKVTTKNSPLWKTNPRQQMSYLQVKNWARLYCPGAILGVYTPDEFDQPAPRNMGTAEIVRPELPASLLEAAENAAQGGVADYQKFWQKSGAESRKLLVNEHERLKAIAIETDKKRTVETPTKTAPAAKTFDEVMAMICEAKTEGALFLAADWINAISDQDQQTMLNDKYDEILSTMRGAS